MWTSAHQNAFDQLKLHVSNGVKLQFYDYRKPLYIEVDTSKKGIGVAMLQEDCIVQNTSRCDIPNNLGLSLMPARLCPAWSQITPI